MSQITGIFNYCILLQPCMHAGMPVNQGFLAEVGPVLLANVTCNQSHLELLQCVYPQDIGVHNRNQENVTGVICPNVSTTTVATMNNPSNITTSTTTTQ